MILNHHTENKMNLRKAISYFLPSALLTTTDSWEHLPEIVVYLCTFSNLLRIKDTFVLFTFNKYFIFYIFQTVFL